MTLSGICASLWVVGNISCAGRNRDLSGHPLLERFQHHLLELIGLLSTEPFVSAVGELFCLEADAGVKLHFESLAGIRLDPLAVDALVLLIGPGILKFVQLKALVFQTSQVSPDALSVAILPILKGVPYRVRHTRHGFLRREAELLHLVANLLFDAVTAFQAVLEADQRSEEHTSELQSRQY